MREKNGSIQHAVFGENKFFRKSEIQRLKWKPLSDNVAGKVNLIQIHLMHPIWSTLKLLNF